MRETITIVHFRARYDLNGNSQNVWVHFDIDGEPFQVSTERPPASDGSVLRMTIRANKTQIQALKRCDFTSLHVITAGN